jgi:hypothetical protein
MTSSILHIDGPEQSLVDPALPDAGLPPAIGVRSYCVFRASKVVPELTDGRGWTYHHHVDMACWRERLYVGWNSCERDEDVWPSRELYSTSIDGITWSDPQEMFPQGVSTPLRMYFFRAPNGRMLVIAGLRADIDKTSEDRKGGLVVREIRPTHSLGDIFTLQQSPTPIEKSPPPFESARDAGFVEACRQLLADTVFLEQQDRGRLLGRRAMKWHRAENWPGGKVPGDNEKWVSGKAFSFFIRPDGAIVGISKMGWTTISTDGGKTWSQPEVPPTLITGKAKVWSQRTSDGRYALVYNPSKRQRFPLIVVRGEDGIHFRDMRIVQGELPRQRYAGRDRSIGPQYVRGISHWADDGSLAAADHRAMWLVYSMNKEDIWVSRLPLPEKADATGDAEPWNLYQPKWSSVTIEPDDSLQLENFDPYDYACATRAFPQRQRAMARFDVTPQQPDGSELEIELLSKFGSRRSVRVSIASNGMVQAADAERMTDLAPYAAGQRLSFRIDIDAPVGQFSLSLNGARLLENAAFAEPAQDLHRISFRTGAARGIGGANPVDPATDRPAEPARWSIARLTVA